MRLGILSDCHLGVSKFRKLSNMQNTYSLINNESFKEAIKILKDNKVDAIIIPGDLFDSPNPYIQSILIANEELSNTNIPTYILGGNHDYSQRNSVIECHAFDLLYGKNLNKIYKNAEVFDLEDIELTMLPYKHMNAENFKNIYKGKLKDKTKHSILIFHGSVNLNFIDSSEEYSLPKEVASNYDLIIGGHIHLPNFIKTKSVSILTPGATMPSPQATSTTQKPSVYIYNTENKNMEIIELNTPPKIHNLITDNINQTLSVISENKFSNDLYFIKYNGKMQDIDDYLYKKSLQNTLNLAIQTNETIDVKSIEKISNFWSFIEEFYPDYYNEFKEIVKEI